AAAAAATPCGSIAIPRGSTANAARFKVLQPGDDAAVGKYDAYDQAEHGERHAAIGQEDEPAMRTQLDHGAAASAACRAIVSARRRKISVRMFMMCSSRNSAVKAKVMTKSGERIENGILGPSAVKTLAG